MLIKGSKNQKLKKVRGPRESLEDWGTIAVNANKLNDFDFTNLTLRGKSLKTSKIMKKKKYASENFVSLDCSNDIFRLARIINVPLALKKK